MTESQREVAIARLNELGVEHVKLLLSHGGLPTEWYTTIYGWLGDKAKERAATEGQSQK